MARNTVSTFVHFLACVTAAEVNKAHRQLARANHPDVGGSHEAMVSINAEFDAVKELFRLDDPRTTWGDKVSAQATSRMWDGFRVKQGGAVAQETEAQRIQREREETLRRWKAEAARQDAERQARERQEAERQERDRQDESRRAQAERDTQARSTRAKGATPDIETIWQYFFVRVEVNRKAKTYTVWNGGDIAYKTTYTGSNWRQTRAEVIERAKEVAGC